MSAGRKCSVDVCDREVYVKGLCYPHYRRERRGKALDTPIAPRGDAIALQGVRVPEAVKKALVAMAEVRGISEYEMIRSIILDWHSRTVGMTLIESVKKAAR